MLVRLAVLAEAANQTSDGKLNILGEFNLIWAAAFPVSWPRIFLVLKLEVEPGDPPQQKLRIRILDEDANSIGPTLEGDVDLGRRFRSGIPVVGACMLEFRNALFPKAGTYEFEVTLGNELLTSVPLYVFFADQRQPPSDLG
jgi:hypothetical protein